jgi:predicted DNA-binding transcriptional regulator AlpA
MTTRQLATKQPAATPGNEVVTANCFADKRAVAAMAGLRSTRWVEIQMTRGMPHLKLGPRRIRFDLEEVRAWLMEKYHQQRNGRVQLTGAK